MRGKIEMGKIPEICHRPLSISLSKEVLILIGSTINFIYNILQLCEKNDDKRIVS